jgi:hypothetical protein
MNRKFALALATTVVLATAALTPTSASAFHGGHGFGGHGFGGHGFGHGAHGLGHGHGHGFGHGHGHGRGGFGFDASDVIGIVSSVATSAPDCYVEKRIYNGSVVRRVTVCE